MILSSEVNQYNSMFYEISLTLKNSLLYKLRIIPELPLYLYARMAELSYQKDALSPLNAHSWTLISEPNVHPVIYAATSNHEYTHVMFTIQGTTYFKDFRDDNTTTYLGNALQSMLTLPYTNIIHIKTT